MKCQCCSTTESHSIGSRRSFASDSIAISTEAERARFSAHQDFRTAENNKRINYFYHYLSKLFPVMD